MNRREFAKSMTAFGLAPALSSLPAAPVAAAPAYTPYMYGLGAHMARSTGASSPAILMQKLGLAPKAAQAMQAQLIRNGIVSAPGAAGLAAATQPYMRGLQVARTATPAAGVRIKRIAQQMLEQDDTPDNDGNSNPPEMA